MRSLRFVGLCAFAAAALSACAEVAPSGAEPALETIDFDALPPYGTADRTYGRRPEGKILVGDAGRSGWWNSRYMACDIRDNAELALEICRDASGLACTVQALGDRDVTGLSEGRLLSAITAYQKRITAMDKLPESAWTPGVAFASLLMGEDACDRCVSRSRITLEQLAPCRGHFGANLPPHGICEFSWRDEDLRRDGLRARSVVTVTAECDDGAAYEGLVVMNGPRDGLGAMTSRDGGHLYLLSDDTALTGDSPVEFGNAWNAKRAEAGDLVGGDELPKRIDPGPESR